MISVDEKTLYFNNRIKIDFKGGNLTSDAGLLLYKEFDEKIGMSRMIQETFKLNDPVWHHTHSNEDVIAIY